MKKLCLLITIFICTNSFAINQNFETAKEQAVLHLENLVKIDTSYPNGKPLDAVRYIYTVLNENNIDWDIYIPTNQNKFPNQANIIAKINATNETAEKGSEKNPKLPPLILVTHLDTVPTKDSWSVDPFSATKKDGYLYGLGVTDNKDLASIFLTILTMLKPYESKLNRDIIFIATTDEEVGGNLGMQYLIDNKKLNIPPSSYALIEGGTVIKDEEGKASIVFVEASTKMYMDIKMTATGKPSHSAIAYKDHAIYKLSKAISTLENYNPPFRLNGLTKDFFEQIYPIQDDDGKTTINMLLSEDIEKAHATANAMSMDPFFKAQLKDVITPTVITSGNEANTISEKATATLNCRLLPDTNPEEFFQNIQNLLKDEDVSLEIAELPTLPFPNPMSTEDELFTSIKTVSEKLMPNAIITAGMSPASGDSEKLRRQGITTYGIGATAIQYKNENN
ncbi:MAG: M20/M25/M40 family metallo-hydrolase, partial [Elusimicrobiaceae bacterium]|nr:M20/M25/M40 family metallo-hydrolase [Elusimicrobiaceae bacterium]